MPDEPKSAAKNETAADFMGGQVERTKGNLRCTINRLGHDALKVANPVPWFQRYPVKCSIVTGALLGGGALLLARSLRRRHDHRPSPSLPPINVYVKNPKPKSKGWGQIGAGLMTVLFGQVSESVRATLSDSFAGDTVGADRPKPRIIPNPNLRGVEI